MNNILQLLDQVKERITAYGYSDFSENITGELGEYYAIEKYSNTPGLPKLQVAPPSTG